MKLGIRPAKNQDGVYKQIEEQLGQQQTKGIRDSIGAAQDTAAL